MREGEGRGGEERGGERRKQKRSLKEDVAGDMPQ